MNREAWIDRAVDDAFSTAVSDLQDVIRIPSVNPGVDTGPVMRRVGELARRLGFAVAVDEVPADLAKAHRMTRAVNVLADMGSPGGPQLVLNAHVDTVAPGDGWRVDPFGARIENGVLYGRGALVSKSDVVGYLYAASIGMRALGGGARGRVTVALTGDEELGGWLGPYRLIRNGLVAPDWAVCPGFTHAVVVTHNGCWQWRVTLRGQSAHAAIPRAGVDPVIGAARVIEALYQYREHLARRSSATAGIAGPWMVVGTIEGGVHANMVADACRFEIDRRVPPDEDMEAAAAEVLEVVREAAAGSGCTVEVEEMLRADPMRRSGGDGGRLVRRLIRDASAVSGRPVAATGSPLYTDARHFSQAGIPVVCFGAGTGGIEAGGAHGPDERLVLEDFRQSMRIVARTVAGLLEAEDF